jgi:hypothetical protein
MDDSSNATSDEEHEDSTGKVTNNLQESTPNNQLMDDSSNAVSETFTHNDSDVDSETDSDSDDADNNTEKVVDISLNKKRKRNSFGSYLNKQYSSKRKTRSTNEIALSIGVSESRSCLSDEEIFEKMPIITQVSLHV